MLKIETLPHVYSWCIFHWIENNKFDKEKIQNVIPNSYFFMEYQICCISSPGVFPFSNVTRNAARPDKQNKAAFKLVFEFI